MFKLRTVSLHVSGDAPIADSVDLSDDRRCAPGEHAVAQLEAWAEVDQRRSLSLAVVADQGDTLHLRAEQDVYTPHGEQLIARGGEFSLPKRHVITVQLPSANR